VIGCVVGLVVCYPLGVGFWGGGGGGGGGNKSTGQVGNRNKEKGEVGLRVGDLTKIE